MPLHRTAPREPGEGERPAISIAATSSNYSDRRPSAYLRRSTVLICSISDLRRRDTALSKSAVDRSRSFWAAIKRRSKPWLLAALHHAALPAPSVSRKPATARQTAPMMPVPAAEAARRRLRKLGYDGKRRTLHLTRTYMQRISWPPHCRRDREAQGKHAACSRCTGGRRLVRCPALQRAQ
jgi:hypothetical protein